MKLRVRETEGNAGRCPYCRDRLGLAGVIPCLGCGVSIHTACWAELDACPSLGCTPPIPAGAQQAEGCISCSAPLPDGKSGACERCRAAHDMRWKETEGSPCEGCARIRRAGYSGRCALCRQRGQQRTRGEQRDALIGAGALVLLIFIVVLFASVGPYLETLGPVLIGSLGLLCLGLFVAYLYKI